MEQDYQVDNLDRKILQFLIKDGRMPFTEIARELVVSTGTVHQRVEKMTSAGIIKSYQVNLDYNRLGKTVSALIGIHLNNAKDCPSVYQHLEKYHEVVEVNFTTGTYALMAKIVCNSVPDFHDFLTTKLQTIRAIRATETFLCLSTPISRPVQP